MKAKSKAKSKEKRKRTREKGTDRKENNKIRKYCVSSHPRLSHMLASCSKSSPLACRSSISSRMPHIVSCSHVYSQIENRRARSQTNTPIIQLVLALLVGLCLMSICRLRVRITYSLFIYLPLYSLSLLHSMHSSDTLRFTINDPPSPPSSPAAAPALEPVSVLAVVVDAAVR